jgi:L-lactate dehydrogenase complex protein LldE
MRIGLFIPCYIDQLFPQVGLATVQVLEKYGGDWAARQGREFQIEFPSDQTCCGQPMANTGCTEEARPLAQAFLRIFHPYDAVVCPSGSCVAMVRHHYEEYLAEDPKFEELKGKTFELCEFLHDVLKLERIEGRFPHKVGLHQSCHGLRELRLGSASELAVASYSKIRRLIETMDDVTFAELERPDECCGFGGTFAVNEEAVSCMMGNDRVHDHLQAGTEVLTAADMSCLMHLNGLIRRQHQPIRVMHIAEIFAGAL